MQYVVLQRPRPLQGIEIDLPLRRIIRLHKMLEAVDVGPMCDNEMLDVRGPLLDHIIPSAVLRPEVRDHCIADATEVGA